MNATEALRQQLTRAQSTQAMLTAAIEQIREKVRIVAKNELHFGALSTEERIAVSLVLDRADLVHAYGSILNAVSRLTPEWLAAASYVQKHGWQEE